MSRGQRANLNTFSLTQLLDYDLFNIESDNLKMALEKRDLKGLVNGFVYLLENVGKWKVEECYAIIHDKDYRELWDEKVMSKVTELKPAHIHMSVKFKKDCNEGATIENIASALAVEPQFIEKPKRGRFSWDNQLSYLIHAKDSDKFQYDKNEVFTFRGKDYNAIYEESKDRWARGAVKKQNASAVEDIDWLESEILQGKITKSEVILTDSYYKIYSLFKRRVDDAFDTYGQRKMYKALKKLEDGEFKTSVYYVMGKSGSGKTSFAWELIKSIQDKAKTAFDEDWTVCRSASTNPVDEYNGEEVLFMDDVRGTSMRADDWLKLLDPWNASPSSARYRNKMVVANVIVITATMTPVEFFYYSKGVGQGSAQSEAVDQFLRRLMAVVEVIDFDEITAKRTRKLEEGCVINYRLPNKNLFGGDILTPSGYEIVNDKTFPNKEEAADFLSDEVIENNNLADKTDG